MHVVSPLIYLGSCSRVNADFNSYLQQINVSLESVKRLCLHVCKCKLHVLLVMVGLLGHEKNHL